MITGDLGKMEFVEGGSVEELKKGRKRGALRNRGGG